MSVQIRFNEKWFSGKTGPMILRISGEKSTHWWGAASWPASGLPCRR
jgi:hypothetical protein